MLKVRKHMPLTITGTTTRGDPFEREIANESDLKTFTLVRKQLATLDLSPLTHYPRLETLSLKENQLTALDLALSSTAPTSNTSILVTTSYKPWT